MLAQWWMHTDWKKFIVSCAITLHQHFLTCYMHFGAWSTFRLPYIMVSWLGKETFQWAHTFCTCMYILFSTKQGAPKVASGRFNPNPSWKRVVCLVITQEPLLQCLLQTHHESHKKSQNTVTGQQTYKGMAQPCSLISLVSLQSNEADPFCHI